MSSNFSRRDWLRASALLTTGLFAAPVLNQVSARTPTTPKLNKQAAAPWNIYEQTPRRNFDLRKLRARLLANENPYGPAPRVVSAIQEASEQGNRYAMEEAKELIQMLAEREGVPTSHIMLGPGSTDLLERTAIAHFMKEKKANIVAPDPSYMSLIATTQAVGAEWKAIPLTADYAHDLPAMENAINKKTKMVYVCNPNNPTGTLTPNGALRAFCDRVSATVPVFMDEAYLEFLPGGGAGSSMVGLVKNGKDVIISRTFSKIHGMAGLRIGYLVGLPSRLDQVRELNRGPQGWSVTSIQAAKASLEEEEFINEVRAKTEEARGITFEILQRLKITPITSHTSFVLFPLQMDGETYLDKMFEQGVGVRVFMVNGQPWSRVSMGTMEEMAVFGQALEAVLR